ncbi:MAG: ECF transporter S component [Eubacteriales bacterium]|nr:ECF transporter S component [Eubacteriales bacterium]MDO5586953.1 ECF transporter S component [Clostridia bacterium]MDY4212305.1 ECF transporter S component [Eubacteriales bacterium]
MKTKTQKIVIAAMLAALTCIATMIIKIPSPLKGYLNLGDCVVLLSGWLLSPLYGFLAAGLGSGLADLISGYGVYVPATFIIKGVMAIAAYFGFRFLQNKVTNISARIVSGIVAELIMVFGYYVFEGFLYGFGASLVNIPANAVQGVAGLIIGTILVKIFEKSKIIKTEV